MRSTSTCISSSSSIAPTCPPVAASVSADAPYALTACTSAPARCSVCITSTCPPLAASMNGVSPSQSSMCARPTPSSSSTIRAALPLASSSTTTAVCPCFDASQSANSKALSNRSSGSCTGSGKSSEIALASPSCAKVMSRASSPQSLASTALFSLRVRSLCTVSCSN
eukprot:4527269-Prymnesium_polylepis.2